MFQALLCSSSGGQNCIIQPLVSSKSVGGRPVHRLREDPSQPAHRAATYSCNDPKNMDGRDNIKFRTAIVQSLKAMMLKFRLSWNVTSVAWRVFADVSNDGTVNFRVKQSLTLILRNFGNWFVQRHHAISQKATHFVPQMKVIWRHQAGVNPEEPVQWWKRKQLYLMDRTQKGDSSNFHLKIETDLDAETWCCCATKNWEIV